MNNSNLVKDKIYKGFYLKDNQNYFCFFKIDETETQGVDIFTNERFKIQNFTSIEYQINNSELKFYKKFYKNKEIFIIKSIEETFINQNFNKILRFFNLLEYNLIFDENIDQETLNKVIIKIQKYFKRYIGFIEAIEFSKQLKKAKTIIEILTFLPKEIVDSNKIPFWVNDIKNHNSEFVSTFYQSLEKIKEYNKYDLSVFVKHKNRDLHSTLIEEKIKKIQEFEINAYKNKCKDKIFERLKEARITLENEYIIANDTKDEDLIFEINIIKDELQKMEQNIDSLNFFDPIIFWWPDMLYPVPPMEHFEPSEQLFFEMRVLHTDYSAIL